MGKNTGIEWATSTWSPWRGCSKKSPGCANCYMYRDFKRFGWDPRYVVRAAPLTFDAPLKWDPSIIFTCSWSDFFLKEADGWRAKAWDIIRRTPQHIYLILTKRPELIINRLPTDWGMGWEHVWLGVSVETPAYSWRADILTHQVRAKHRFISYEPALESPSIDDDNTILGCFPERIEWVICGGESGPNHTPFDPTWGLHVRALCHDHGIPFFMKQMGGWPNKQTAIERFPPMLRIREFPDALKALRLIQYNATKRGG